jgi:tetratricopeptide (TPR) repeat protein
MTKTRLIALLAAGFVAGLVAIAPAPVLAQEAQWAQRMMAATAALKRRDLAGAESELEKALAIAEGFGEKDPRLARTLHNLAYIYRAEGRLALAEPHYLHALGIQEAVLGKLHPDVALTLNNLGGLYREQGYYERAEPLYRRSLAIRERALGATHPEVAESLNNLAGLLRLTDRNVEAEALGTRAIAIMEANAGTDHAKIAAWLYNLSRLYLEQGRFEEAAKFEARAREMWLTRATQPR